MWVLCKYQSVRGATVNRRPLPPRLLCIEFMWRQRVCAIPYRLQCRCCRYCVAPSVMDCIPLERRN
jgi:hypothetical protein